MPMRGEYSCRKVCLLTVDIRGNVRSSEEDDPVGFAARVIDLLRSPEKREYMGEAARHYVVRNHSWDTVGKRIIEIWEDAAIRRSGTQRKE